MNTIVLITLFSVVFLLIGIGLGVTISYIKRRRDEAKIKDTLQQATETLKEAKREAEEKKKEIIEQAKVKANSIINEAEQEKKLKGEELKNRERRLLQKEKELDSKIKGMSLKEEELIRKEEDIDLLKKELENTLKRQIDELETIAKLSEDEAKQLLFKNIEKELKYEIAKKIKEAEDRIKIESDRRAKEIIALAMQKCSLDHFFEPTTTVVALPSDEMKGRLIGREGRNIRTFETLTGADLIVDDTPEAVVISCFDPIRREIAKLTIEKLILDGRIQPARIEEMYEKAKKEVEEKIYQEGEQAALEVGVNNLHPELIKLLGRLRFRTSYGQNVLQNSIEAAKLAAYMAAELNVDKELAKRAALLHDIGKALTKEVEGPHAKIGAELARKYREPKGVVHAIAAHHNEEEPLTIEAILVQVADAISSSRPGVRRDTWEAYIQRLEKLEEVAESFEGIEKAYAIQAGREIRVIVKSEEVDDILSAKLAQDIAREIEKKLDYPGQIKVTVIREVRTVEYAK